jgi:hypothetical protein
MASISHDLERGNHMRLTRLKALALPVAAVFATVACGGGGTSGGTTSKGTIVLASDYPASGG